YRVRPAGIEREMGDDLRDLRGLDPMLERKFEVICKSNRLVSSDHCGKRDDAAVAGRQAGPLPHLTEQSILRVFVEGRRDHLNLLASGASLRWRSGRDCEREGQSSKRKS